MIFVKKMPTLFRREFNRSDVTIFNEVTLGCEWVLEGEGKATLKTDGACCAIINGIFYKRYDAKNGKPIPEDAILCQAEGDAVTGHIPCWRPVTDATEDKWFRIAKENSGFTEDGTYEAVGPKFNANPEGLNDNTLIKHGDNLLEVERSFEGIKMFLEKNRIEGIVFWRENGDRVKIKRSDFGFEWVKKTR